MKCPVCEKEGKKVKFGEYTRCKICQSLFLEHNPSLEAIQADSDEYADIIFDTDVGRIDVIHTQRLDALAQYIPKKSKILDVGCGNGIFLQAIARAGHTPVAMDIAPKIIEHMKKIGIQGYTKLSKIPEKSFDAATAFDVIEHTIDPQLFVREVKATLKKNGVVMFTTPNLVGVSGRILRTKWHAFGPGGHNVLFSPQSLKLILENNGFEILSLKTDTFTQWFVPSTTLPKKIANKILYTLFSPIKEYAYAHYLGDNIEFIARLK